MEKMSIEKTNVNTLSNELKGYIDSLNEKEMKAYMIAKDHLGSSFDLEKSNGFIKWKNNQP